jgi:hypothetical protein
MAKVVILLDNAQSQCDCDWRCWLAAGAFFVLAAAAIAGTLIAAELGPVLGILVWLTGEAIVIILTWYPEGCVSLGLEHRLHSPYQKSIVERTIEYL